MTKDSYSQTKEAKLLEDEIDKRIAKYLYYSKDINELRCRLQLIGSAINGGLASTKREKKWELDNLFQGLYKMFEAACPFWIKFDEMQAKIDKKEIIPNINMQFLELTEEMLKEIKAGQIPAELFTCIGQLYASASTLGYKFDEEIEDFLLFYTDEEMAEHDQEVFAKIKELKKRF
ncbi:MAG: hypothetical protein V1734_04900 [Nanoarchaeota archaeon]